MTSNNPTISWYIADVLAISVYSTFWKILIGFVLLVIVVVAKSESASSSDPFITKKIAIECMVKPQDDDNNVLVCPNPKYKK